MQALQRLALATKATPESAPYSLQTGGIQATLVDEVEAAVDGVDQKNILILIMISSCLIIAGTISAQASL